MTEPTRPAGTPGRAAMTTWHLHPTFLRHLHDAPRGVRYGDLERADQLDQWHRQRWHRDAALARVDEQAVYAATLASFDGTALDLTGLDPADRHSYRQIAARGWTPAHGTQICPACLAETGAWKATWRLLLVTACTHHGLVLVAECPSCGRPFRDQRHSHLRRVGAATVCGNPLGQGPVKQCQRDLAALPREPAWPSILATQARINSALTGEHVMVLGQLAQPAAYLADLRHLTTLLLHLAGQPRADGLAPWVADLALVAADRTSARGPRWGMRPPDDPALRGQALATADAILAADDLDTAATLLTPWTELTPTTNDGPLGWLADRTVMTATLTRLVMAARAPHRRLSHHLDTPGPDGARMPINLLVIPQVIPHAVPRAPRGRVCLRRGDRPPLRLPVTGAAAPGHPVLGCGRRSAGYARLDGRALRPSMHGDHARCRRRMEGRIWRAGEESPRRDYRATEAGIRHRLGTRRWFDEWARRNRPGTPYGAYDLGLTWQWVHVAHAHLDPSPAWRGRKPTARDRARYRRFEKSLDAGDSSWVWLAPCTSVRDLSRADHRRHRSRVMKGRAVTRRTVVRSSRSSRRMTRLGGAGRPDAVVAGSRLGAGTPAPLRPG
ncbi:hypothetical protein BN13_800013 [Nostocoides jenkinsii Ben 74]|uniref:TniQ domain-containing protein n=2 Tax=Nostocoides jenkinsii TaxID=330834 RepID=A0A077MGS0_9MICO|nr:hypothetical protein BN13_800013 [Tetrasphaera jenkinsii Ben 74]